VVVHCLFARVLLEIPCCVDSASNKHFRDTNTKIEIVSMIKEIKRGQRMKLTQQFAEDEVEKGKSFQQSPRENLA
jgi:hypothetical protein